MWKIYKHEIVQDVVLVEPDGHEHKITTEDTVDDFFYTVEDRDDYKDELMRHPKAVFTKGETHIKRFRIFSEAVTKCAILNSGA